MSHRHRGFTLIELMVVLGVVSVLAVMIVPRFEGTYRRSLLRATARELAAAVDLASSRAATTVKPHRLRVDPASGEWSIEERVAGGRFEPVSSVPGAAGRLEAGIRVRIEAGPGAPVLVAGGPEDSPGGPDAATSARVERGPSRASESRDPSGTGATGGAAGRTDSDRPAPAEGAGFEQAVTFRPDGTSDGGELVLEVEDGARMALRIHPSTGRVRILDLGREIDGGPQPPRSEKP